MKKHLLIYCILLSTIATGQKKDYISLSFLSAFPVGDFKKAETRYNSSILGYAKWGLGGDLTYVHKNNRSNFGFAATLRTRQNKIDTATFLAEKARQNPFVPAIPTFAWAKERVKWLLLAGMIGGYYGKSLSARFTLNAKILAGIAKATLPEINWKGRALDPYYGYSEFKREKATYTCMSTCAATGFEFAFSKQISLIVNGEYWYAKPTFKDIDQTTFKSWSGGGGGNTTIQINERSQYIVDMSTINLNIGLAFNL